MKTSKISANNFKKILDLDGSTPEPVVRTRILEKKRKYGEVSGSGHAAYTLSIFPASNFFRGMEYPISGQVIETRRVKTCKRPYFSRFAENHGVPLMNATIFAFHFH